MYANSKNIFCFYILKNASNMTCPTIWYSDTVYSDYVGNIHACAKPHLPL